MCRLRPVWVPALVMLAVAVLMPGPVRAEVFLDFYGGGAFPLDSDTRISGAGNDFIVESEYKESWVAGGRVGYYFDIARRLALGVALDASYFKADIDLPNGARNEVVPISLLLMVRTPLAVTQEFPHGRFQPYAGIGPSFVYSKSKEGAASDTSFDVGLDFRIGFTWMMTRVIGLFGEYRFSYVQPEYELNGRTVEPEFGVSHVTAGVTFRF